MGRDGRVRGSSFFREMKRNFSKLEIFRDTSRGPWLLFIVAAALFSLSFFFAPVVTNRCLEHSRLWDSSTGACLKTIFAEGNPSV